MVTDTVPASGVPSPATPLRFTCTSPLYAFAPDAKPRDMLDQVACRLSQLEAMLVLAHVEFDGPDGDTPALGALADDLQANYLWACQQMVQECRALVLQVSELRSVGGVK